MTIGRWLLSRLMTEQDGSSRNLARLVVPAVGSLAATADPWEPYRLLDADGVVVDPVASYFRDLQASGRSTATLRSYGMDLLRWFRFTWAVDVPWSQATRVEARDFSCWIQATRKRRPVSASAGGGGSPGAPNPVTGKPSPGRTYAAATVAHSARLEDLCETVPDSPVATRAFRRITAIMAAKGGLVADITAGDCLQALYLMNGMLDRGADRNAYFYQLMHATGVFPADAPASVRTSLARGQLAPGQMIDRYDIACRPVRDLLVDYLRERQPSVDYDTLRNLAQRLGSVFWRDLELHHPGIDSLHLPPDVAAEWKQRSLTTTVAGKTQMRATGLEVLTVVRAFYLDIAEWALEDPARWGPWAAPCPVRGDEPSRRKELSRRKARMDQRTRERLPVLPALVASADAQRRASGERLEAAMAAIHEHSVPTPAGRAGSAAAARGHLRQPDRPHRRSPAGRPARRSRGPQSQPRGRRSQAHPGRRAHRPPTRCGQPGHALFPRHRRPHRSPRQGGGMTSPATLAAGLRAHAQGLYCLEAAPAIRRASGKSS